MAEDESKPSLQALLDAIQKLWQLFHPPAFAVIAGVGLAYALVGPFELIDQGPGLHGVFSDTAIERLDKLGLKSLLPAIALGVLLLSLQLLRQIVQSLGDLLPPFLVVQPEHLFQAFLSDEQMATAWSRYDQATDLADLDVIVDRELDAVGKASRVPMHSQIKEWADSIDRLKWWLTLFKMFLYSIPILAGVSILYLHRPTWFIMARASIFEALALIVYGFVGVRFLHAVQQHTGSRVLLWNAARDQAARTIDPSAVAQRLQQLRATSHGRWWAIVFRTPIRTGRLSELLTERLNKDDLRKFKGGNTV